MCMDGSGYCRAHYAEFKLFKDDLTHLLLIASLPWGFKKPNEDFAY